MKTRYRILAALSAVVFSVATMAAQGKPKKAPTKEPAAKEAPAKDVTPEETPTQSGPGRDVVLKAAREIMIATRYATFVTIGPGGQPQARVVDAFGPDTSLTVWIATNALTRKVAELKKDPRVTLLYFSPVTFEYVTLQGTVTLSTDARDRQDHWKRDWSALYKDEWRGPDYLLIKFKPSHVEVVSQRRGINNDPVNWRPTSVDIP